MPSRGRPCSRRTLMLLGRRVRTGSIDLTSCLVYIALSIPATVSYFGNFSTVKPLFEGFSSNLSPVVSGYGGLRTFMQICRRTDVGFPPLGQAAIPIAVGKVLAQAIRRRGDSRSTTRHWSRSRRRGRHGDTTAPPPAGAHAPPLQPAPRLAHGVPRPRACRARQQTPGRVGRRHTGIETFVRPFHKLQCPSVCRCRSTSTAHLKTKPRR